MFIKLVDSFERIHIILFVWLKFDLKYRILSNFVLETIKYFKFDMILFVLIGLNIPDQQNVAEQRSWNDLRRVYFVCLIVPDQT